MAQLNVNLDPKTEENLRTLMRLKSIPTKSDAVRLALAEAAERASRGGAVTRYADWLGAGRRVPTNPAPRFTDEDELWESS